MTTIPTHIRRFLLPYAAFWLAVGAVYEVLYLMTPDVDVEAALVTGLQIIGIAAILGLGVVWIAARTPWPSPRPVRTVALHALGAVFYSMVWIAFVATLRNVELLASDAPFQLRLPPDFVVRWHLIAGSALYLAMVTGVYALKAEAARRSAEVRALKEQLDPHFLFNTLHTISMLFRSDAEKAEAGMEMFSDLIRYALKGGEEGAPGGLVPLSEEWAMARKYLSLEQLRLEDRLRLETQIDDAALACLVPPLLLQPLLENAVVHAAALNQTGATITVRAARANGRLSLCVDNDGVDPARSGPVTPGVGLKSLNARLVAAFGAGAALDVEPMAAGHFRVCVALPAREVP